MQKSLLIVIFALILALAALIYFVKRIEEKLLQERYETVKETSLKYKSLIEYNARWSIGDCPIELTYKIPFPTREEAKNADTDSLLEKEIRDHYNEVMSARQEVDRKKEQHKQYLDQMRSILMVTPDSFIRKTGINAAEYRKLENVLCEEHTIKPKTELIITIRKTYTRGEQGVRAIVKHYKGEELDKAIFNEWRNRVLFFSDRIAKQQAINNAYRDLFVAVEPRHTYQKYCSSFGEFKKYANNDLYMEEKLRKDLTEIVTEIEGAKENKKYYDQYLNMINKLGSSDPSRVKASGVPEQTFLSLEQSVILNTKLPEPVTSFSRGVMILYFSPQRGNRHEFNREYSDKDLMTMLERQKRAEANRARRNEERSKMTNSLRYDVMKRDGFRCVLCGAGSEDGAKLHVDHIVPVSKGGKTTIDNLRTLCDRCNSGKRDKYDPYGPN